MIKELLPLAFLVILSFNLSAQEQLPTEQKVTFGQDGKIFINKKLGVYVWLSTSPDESSKKHRLKSYSSKKYSNPMYFDTEGYNTFRSPSAVNPETRKTVYPLHDIVFEVYADGLAPKTRHKILSEKSVYRYGKIYYKGNIAATFTAFDKVSGVEKTYYSKNGKSYNEKKDTIQFSTEGETVLKYYSTDKVGNREEAITKKFIIDNSAPITECEIDGIVNEKFVSPLAVIKLKSIDSLIGVKAIYYQINNGSRRLYSSPVSVKYLANEGSMVFYAVDYLDNTEKMQVIGGKDNALNIQGKNVGFEFYVDNAPPTINVDFNGDFYKGKYTYVSPKTKLSINAYDDKSGVDKINYSINSNKIDQNYDGAIEFNGNGIVYIRINATDFVGNKSITITNVYYVDTKIPVSTVTVLSPKHKVKDTLFITSKTKIKLAGTDNASGIKEIIYSIEENEKVKYTEPFVIDSEKLTKLNYLAVDNVNNKEPVNTIGLFVDNIPPVIYHHFSTTSIGTKTVREQKLTIYPGNVQLYIAATDEDSGGEKIEYKINNSALKTVNPIKDLQSGNYEVEITAYDVLGNSSKQTIKFSVED